MYLECKSFGVEGGNTQILSLFPGVRSIKSLVVVAMIPVFPKTRELPRVRAVDGIPRG